ncbi:MAG: hypothetical protein BGO38_05125 [Cellulomonas sp. 73-145]|uniref:PH-like domain-containing protein n=1 Tax=Cellulomonas sp. 73-145 TaxID=1895739 RepID=UPI00092A13DF|nr:hypothetical protein [Cellulomonas sp. 73-145]OJV57520.1 MAG: hypothetical protein BGO38_05125 [Cellulomonas sp. 73-145]
MPTWLSVTILLVLLALAYWAMRQGWRRRERRSEATVPAVPGAPADLGAPRTDPLEAVYVSSTTAGDWLDRVNAHDLGVRSAAQVQVFDAGVLVRRTGAADVFVPAAQVRGVGTASGMAGKFMGRDGLVVLTWAPDAAPEVGPLLDTGLLVRHRADRPRLVDAVRTLVPTTAGGTA